MAFSCPIVWFSDYVSFVFRGGSVATYGAIGTLGVVWLFDVQLSDYLKYVPVFRRRFGDNEEHWDEVELVYVSIEGLVHVRKCIDRKKGFWMMLVRLCS